MILPTFDEMTLQHNAKDSIGPGRDLRGNRLTDAGLAPIIRAVRAR